VFPGGVPVQGRLGASACHERGGLPVELWWKLSRPPADKSNATTSSSFQEVVEFGDEETQHNNYLATVADQGPVLVTEGSLVNSSVSIRRQLG
jgi:hypothetical protein